MGKKEKKIKEFFARDDWSIDENTPEYIKEAYTQQDFYKDPEEPEGPDLTPIFHYGVTVGCRQDVLDGKLDLLDRDMWR